MRQSEVATEKEEEKNISVISEDFDFASSFHVCSILQAVFSRAGQISWFFLTSTEETRAKFLIVIDLTHLTIRRCFSASSRKEWNSLSSSDFISLTRFDYSKNRKRKRNCSNNPLIVWKFVCSDLLLNVSKWIWFIYFAKRFPNHSILQKTQEQGRVFQFENKRIFEYFTSMFEIDFSVDHHFSDLQTTHDQST